MTIQISAAGKPVQYMEFWSTAILSNNPNLSNVVNDYNYTDIVVSGIPVGATLLRVAFEYHSKYLANDSGAVNTLVGTQTIRIKKSTGAWDVDDVDCYTDLVDTIYLEIGFNIANFIMHGDLDVKSEVDGDAIYNVQWEDGDVTGNYFRFRNSQSVLRVWFT